MNRREYIYVGNVEKSCSEQELKEFFWKSGKALKVYFMREYIQASPTKVAFIQFETENQARNACVMDQSVLKGCRLVVMMADDERFFQAESTIIARNLSPDTTESNVYDLFRKFGALVDVAIPHGSFAYICFREQSVAERVANNPNIYLKGNRLGIQVLQHDIPIRLESLDTLKSELEMNNKPVQMTPTPQPQRHHQASASNYMDEMIPVAPPPPIIRGHMSTSTANAISGPSRTLIQPQREGIMMEVRPAQAPQRFNGPPQQLLDNGNAPPPPVFNNFGQPRQQFTQPRRQIPDEVNFEIDQGPFLEPVATVTPNTLQPVHFAELAFKIDTSMPPLQYEYAIFIENIPKEVCEDEVYDHFAKFGEIYHMKFTTTWNCAFTKNAQIIYNNQEAFMNSREFFAQTFRDSYIFVTRLREFVELDPRRTIILEYDVNYITFEDVRNTLRLVGDVVYWTRSSKNKYDTYVVFRGFVNYDRLRKTYDICGEEVHVLRYDPSVKRNTNNAVIRKLEDMNESEIVNPLLRLKFTKCENLKNFDLNGYCVAPGERLPLKTTFNPDYMNPDPVKFNNEVQVNGSKRNITLGDLRRYFQGTGDVVTFRFRESEFSDTWTLFVSFESYIQAKRACRVRGSLMGNHVFKHMANEKVDIDPERTYFFEGVPLSADVALQVSTGRLIITEQQIYARCVGMMAIDYIEKKSRLTAVIMFTKPLNDKKKLIRFGQFEGRLSYFKEYAQEARERMLQDEMIEMQKIVVNHRQESEFNPYYPSEMIPPNYQMQPMMDMSMPIAQPVQMMNDIVYQDEEEEPNKFEIYARNPQFCPPISQFISIFNNSDDNEPQRERRSFSREREQFRNKSRSKSRSRSRRRTRTPPTPRAKDFAKLEAEIKEKEMALKRRLEDLDRKLDEANKLNDTQEKDKGSHSRGKDNRRSRSREKDVRKRSRSREKNLRETRKRSRSPVRGIVKRSLSISPARRIVKRSRSRSVGRRNVRKSRSRSVGRRNIKRSRSRSTGRRIVKKSRSRSIGRKNVKRSSSRSPAKRIVKRSISRERRPTRRPRSNSIELELEDLQRRLELMEEEFDHLNMKPIPKPWEKDRIIYLGSKLKQMKERKQQLTERVQKEPKSTSKSSRVLSKERDSQKTSNDERWSKNQFLLNNS